jgi:hypothetical protein
MRRLIFFSIFFPLITLAQQASVSRLNVFIDCSNTWCDMTFIRSEITAVNFSLDRVASDIHVLITSTDLGGGGDQYQLIFYGQKNFSKVRDTLRLTVSPNATDFEERDLLVKYIKAGLVPIVAKTAAFQNVVINMKSDTSSGESNKNEADKWNYWVYRTSVDGNFEAGQVYNSGRISGRLSANRITDKAKVNFNVYGGMSRDKYDLSDGQEIVDNHNYGAGHYYIKSISEHWGGGYEVSYAASTFSNNKGRSFLRLGLEYNIFPYSEVNNKLFTISYGPFVQNNTYYDSTIFDKKKELLYGHIAIASLSLNQKWGTVGIGLAHRNYFHNWKYFYTGLNANVDVRITGGLSFYVFLYGGFVHDQIYLSKVGVSSEDVLTRRRELASSFNIAMYFGLTYRFGSILNNFINPRFSGPGNDIF